MSGVGLDQALGGNEANHTVFEQQEPVLKTKLLIPSIRTNHVARPRLITKLNDNLEKSLILISAPAGYGKTTLLAEWIATSKIPLGWVSLDEYDNDLARFWAYSIAALENIQTNIGSNTRVLIKNSPFFPTTTFLPTLINDISESSASFFLILDDYQFITNPVIHDTLGYMVDHLPSQMHLVIATRGDPPLPLPRLRSRYQVAEIREKDLRFTSEEVAQYLRNCIGLELPVEDIRALEARTEGWIVGLQTASLSIRGREEPSAFIQSFSGSNRYILDYLKEEVLYRQSEDIQKFLLETSILDSLCGNLCDAVTLQADSQGILERIEKANLFLIPLNEERQWYRYHHLLTDILRTLLQQTQPKLLAELHIRASCWYEERGWLEKAIQHALAAKDFDYAAHLIERNAWTLLSGGEVITLLSWLQALPSDFKRNRPWLSIYIAWAMVMSGQNEGVESLLEKIEFSEPASLSVGEKKDISGNIAGIHAWMNLFSGKTSEAIERASLALQSLSEKSNSARVVVTMVLAVAYGLMGDFEKSCQAYYRVIEFAQLAANPYISVLAMCDIAIFRKIQGRLRSAYEIYKEARRILDKQTGVESPILANIDAGEGDVLREWNDFAGAERLIRSGIKYGVQRGRPDPLVRSYIALARLLQESEDLDGATDALQEAECLARQSVTTPFTKVILEKCLVSLWLAKNNLQAVSSWVTKYRPIPESSTDYTHEPEYIALARVFLVQKKTGEALNVLSLLAKAAEAGGRNGSLIEILVLQALVFQASKNTGMALRTLEKALLLAEPEGYMRVFLDEGHPIYELLDAIYHQEGPSPKEYVGKLLAAFPDYQLESTLSEPITKREQEILGLIASGLTNQQIAEKLYLATGTVRAHTANIYRKLDVSSRTQAVARAKELNLLKR